MSNSDVTEQIYPQFQWRLSDDRWYVLRCYIKRTRDDEQYVGSVHVVHRIMRNEFRAYFRGEDEIFSNWFDARDFVERRVSADGKVS